MALESGTYIDALNVDNPANGDSPREGDDHLKLIKKTIKNTFPNLAGAVTATQAELNHVDGVTSAIQTQLDAKAALAAENAWTAQQTPLNGSATATTVAAWDCDTTGQVYDLAVGTSAFDMSAPTNVLNRTCYILRVTQHATTARAITWNAAYKFPGGVDPVLSTTLGAVDIFTFIGGSGNVMHCVGVAKGLA